MRFSGVNPFLSQCQNGNKINHLLAQTTLTPTLICLKLYLCEENILDLFCIFVVTVWRRSAAPGMQLEWGLYWLCVAQLSLLWGLNVTSSAGLMADSLESWRHFDLTTYNTDSIHHWAQLGISMPAGQRQRPYSRLRLLNG